MNNEMECWLRNTVAATFDEMKLKPDQAVSLQHVRAQLAKAHQAASRRDANESK
jgi:hypothetical protein